MKALVKRIIIKKVDFHKLREKRGISMEQLALLTGKRTNHLFQYQKGNLKMSEKTWGEIKCILDMPEKELVNKLKELK